MARPLSTPGGLLAVLVAAVVLLTAHPAPLHAAADDLGAGLRTLAAHLIDRLQARLRTAAPSPIAGRRPRVVLWPFADAPVPPEVAQRFNDILHTELAAASGARFDLVSPLLLREIMAELATLPRYRHGIDNPVAALLAYNEGRTATAATGFAPPAAPIDVVIIPRMQRFGQRLSLHYDAVALPTGTTLAAATADGLPVPEESTVCAATRPLPSALDQAANAFREHLHDMEALHSCGIRFEDSQSGTPLGNWLEQKVEATLAAAFADVVTDTTLKVFRDGVGCGGLRGLSGPDDGGEDGARHYYLSGRYWLYGDAIDLHLTLRGRAGSTYPWEGCVARRDLPSTIPAEPKDRVPATIRENLSHGPITSVLDSARGRSPTYRVGEELQLTLELSHDAWVHCLYRDSAGQTTKIFPNPYHTDALLPGGVVHRIPGDEDGAAAGAPPPMPFRLIFREPTGVEALKCFATAEDITPRLPPDLQRHDLRPLPPDLADTFPAAFREAAPENLSESSLVITVER